MFNRIKHAKAYCETFLTLPLEFGEPPIMESLRKVDITAVEAVSIIREAVERNVVYGTDIILREMDTEEFKRYVAREIGL